MKLKYAKNISETHLMDVYLFAQNMVHEYVYFLSIGKLNYNFT